MPATLAPRIFGSRNYVRQ